ncbi:unnamed protein product [Alopecurus aequalis]
MAAAKATPFLLLLALALSFVVASSVAVHHPQGAGAGGFFGFGGGIPEFGGGQRSGVSGGWGAGGVGPGGGFARRGVVQPSMVCAEKGPCNNKRLTCPSRCFSSYSYNGKNSAGGGGSGGCTFDCTARCQASC